MMIGQNRLTRLSRSRTLQNMKQELPRVTRRAVIKTRPARRGAAREGVTVLTEGWRAPSLLQSRMVWPAVGRWCGLQCCSLGDGGAYSAAVNRSAKQELVLLSAP